MHMPQKRFLPLLLCAALTAAVLTVATRPAHAFELLDRIAAFARQEVNEFRRSPDDPPPFRVGLVLPAGGPLGEAADRVRNGWRIAMAMSDGYVGELPIEIVQIDSSKSPEDTVRTARMMTKEWPIHVYAGVIGAATAEAMIAHAAREDRPLVLAGAIAEELLADRCQPHVARTSFSIGPYIRTSGRFMASKYKTIVTLAPDAPASFRVMKRFTDVYRASGGRVIEQVWAPDERKYDWSALLARASETGPQAIYAFFEERNAERIVYQHSRTQLKENVGLSGPEWMFGPRSLVRRGKHADGNRFLASHLPTGTEPANRLFVEAYRAAYREDPDVYAYMGYENALAVLLTAADLDGRVENGPSYIEAMKSVSYTGLMPRGTFAFNAVNSAVLTRLYWVEAVYDGDEARMRQIATIPIDEDPATCRSETGEMPGGAMPGNAMETFRRNG